ncbi:hypothetical protein SUGI_0648450 [Cryptomeria japonica]|uniref:cyclin-T1-4 n=1 Tax=Cryptomeria japonica TaxID=3369 RepID=UPI002414C227|nr:cyclin-T1-4 [Cryptomeria japonica]XP_057839355.1 cyclin-T1-4 [Cryptomeria japonica]GLJ32218.1 hypothetical protein SUGI_0648450 [Cryptomeria japonica]
MAGLLDPTNLGIVSSGASSSAHGKLDEAHGKLEEPDHSSSNWYFGREEIEKNSPSRNDGIDLKRETYFRKSYCTFLQDLGMRLKLPQVTIATAIVFCHRFFHRQSHSRNDRYTIATGCMFLAGKVEETPRPLKDVIIISYEIRNKKDPEAVQKIRQKEVYEQQKELTLFGERVVLATLGFDLNVHHPYKPLVAAIKKFKVAQNALAQVAWNFVNDGLRTSLCLQFKPHHIAAGAIFLAAKFLKVKLPSDGEVVWWQEFDVTPLQLEEISNQMLELYEQNKLVPPARGSEIGGSSGINNQNLGHSQSCTEAAPSKNGYSQVPKCGSPGPSLTAPAIGASHVPTADVRNSVNTAKYAGSSHVKQNDTFGSTDYEETYGIGGSTTRTNDTKDRFKEGWLIDDSRQDSDPVANDGGQGKCDDNNNKHNQKRTKHFDEKETSSLMENAIKELAGSRITMEEEENDRTGNDSGQKFEDSKGKKTWIGLGEVNKDKVKAALEKRRKSRGEGMDPRPIKGKFEPVDVEDLIERELESGIEAAAKVEKAKERKERAKLLYKAEQETSEPTKEQREHNENGRKRKKSNTESFREKKSMSCEEDIAEGDQERDIPGIPYDCTEEGELPDIYEQMHSPRLANKLSPGSYELEKGGSPVRRRDNGTRDQQGQRDVSHENKHRHGNHHHHHSSHQQQQQYRGDSERDRHVYKDRDKQERDHKKIRYDHGN